MNEVNKTLYIPLYGKASVSKKGIILQDTKAEEIWKKEGFELHGKAKSKWLTYYMAMRARVFDEWVMSKQKKHPAVSMVLHIGCGMDSRVERIGRNIKDRNENAVWYDIDFPAVIAERRKYYKESESYCMLAADASKTEWIGKLSDAEEVIVIMEGISMYLTNEELCRLVLALQKKFRKVYLLMDCYTVFAAKASKYKNPIKDVGVSLVYGLDEPKLLEKNKKIRYLGERDMTPPELVNELEGLEKVFFQFVFAGKMSKKMYRLYEYEVGSM